MFKNFMPREDRFYTFFRESADLIVEGARAFKTLTKEMDRSSVHAQLIKDIEHKADEVTHKTVSLLHKTFITPLDREDIHALITKMDDVLDLIDAAAQRISLFGVEKSTQDLVALADICIHAAEKVKSAVDQIENLKNPDELLKICIEINRLENEGDHALRVAMAKLFKEETDVKNIIKMKEIYEILEAVTDRCEDVANIIEGIVLEYA